jgi:hypothetical protein
MAYTSASLSRFGAGTPSNSARAAAPLSLRLVDQIDQRSRVHPQGCPVIVAKRNGLLDERIYKQRAGGLDRTRAHHRFLIMLLIMGTAET